MGALREILARFDVDVDPKGALKKGDKDVDSLSKKLRQMGDVLQGAVVIGGIKSFIGGLADAGDQIIDTSARLGLATGEYQQWALAAKLSGVEAGTFAAGVKKLQANISEAGAGGAKTGGIFQELGVDLRNADGTFRETTDIMGAVGEAIAELPNQADRTRKAMDAFGKAGADLNPMFAGGADGLRDLLGEFDRLGGGYSEAALERIGELGDNTDRAEFALTSFKSEIAVSVLPMINNLIAGGTKLVASFKAVEGITTHVKAALVVLGVAAAAAGWNAIKPWIPLTIALAGAYLIVDDLLVALKGGDSVIAGVLDKLLGKGAGKSIFLEINKDLKALNDELKNADGFGSALEKTFSKVGGSLVKFFADELPSAIGVATNQMKAADTTWRDLFKDAGTLEQEIIAKRHQSYKDASATQRAGLLDAADAEVAKWEKFESGLTNDQKLFRRQKFEAAGTVDPADQWRENQKVLRNLVGGDKETASLAESRAQAARLRSSFEAATGTGFAVTRQNEEYGTRVNENSITTNVPIVINVADGEGAVSAITGLVGGAIKRGAEATLKRLAPDS